MTALHVAAVPPGRATLPVGSPGPSFEGLRAVDGQRYGLPDFTGSEIVVLIFSSNRCPTAKAYSGRMNELQRAYGPRGVQLVAINANDPYLYPDEGFDGMVARALEDGYVFPFLVDEGQQLAKAYGAQCTFHVFVLDRNRRIRYEGRFDDSRLPERVTSHDLRNALDDLLEGRNVGVPQTRAFGCSLDFT